MPKSEPPVIQPPLPRPSRWPYWVFVPLCACTDNTGCVVALLHRRAIVGWNYGFRPRPTDPAESLAKLTGSLLSPVITGVAIGGRDRGFGAGGDGGVFEMFSQYGTGFAKSVMVTIVHHYFHKAATA